MSPAPPRSPSSPSPEELLEHIGFVRSLVHALVRDPEVADDLVQEAMLAAIERPPVLNKGLRSWLRGVVRRRISMHYRGEGRRSHREMVVARWREDGSEPPQDFVENALQRIEQSRLIVQAVAELREPYRTAIVLRYLEELFPKEIALTLGLPLNTVDTHLQRGLSLLRERLDRAYGGSREAWMSAFSVFLPSPAGTAETVGTGAGGGISPAGIKVAVAAVSATVAITAGVFLAGSLAGRSQAAERDQVAARPAAPPAGTARDVPVPVPAHGPAERQVVSAVGLWVEVVDEGGLPLQGASVRSSEDGEPVRRTDADGVVEYATTAGVTLWVTHPGRLSVFKKAPAGEERLERVVLHAGAARTVRVVDAIRRTPIPGAEVTYALLREGPLGEPRFGAGAPLEEDFAAFRPTQEEREWLARAAAEGPRPAVSDERGEVTVHGRPDGTSKLNVRAPGYATAWSVPVSLDGRDVRVVELERATALRIVRGSLEPERHIEVRILPAGSTRSDAVRLPPGLAVLEVGGLAPGRYHVVATAHADEPSDVRLLEAPFGMLWNLPPQLPDRFCYREVLLEREVGADVRVFEPDGVDVIVRPATVDGLEELLVLLQVDHVRPFLASMAEREGDGFRFRSVAPGTYRLNLNLAGQPLVLRRIEVPAADEPVVIQVPLGGSTLEVTCLGGEQELHSVVQTLHGPLDADPAEPRTWNRLGASARYDGLFPGEYELWVTGLPLLHRRVHVLEGANELTVDRADVAIHRLSVRSADAPIHKAEVYTARGFLLGNSTAAWDEDAGATGIFELPAGRYHLVCGGPGGASLYHDVRLDADKTILLDWSEVRTFRLLLTRDGDPLASKGVALLPGTADWFEDRWRIESITSPEGVLEVRVPPGAYRIHTAEGHRAEIELASDATEQRVSLRSP